MKTSEKIQSYTSNKMLEVQNFINEIKSDLIGKSIEQILITKPDDEYIGLLGNYDCDVSKINENIELIISTTVFLKIENIYFSIGYERDNFKCINEGALFVYVDILPNKPDKDIIDLSHYYSTNTLNKKIMDIVADEYGEINFILENGYNFTLDSYDADEVRFFEAKVFKKNEVNCRKFDNILYERYDLLNQYINTIKSKYIGKKIEKIMRLGIMFRNMDSFEPENNLILDEFIDILVDNNHLNIDFWEDSPFCNTYVGENLFDYTETSYQDGCSWRNISHLYLKNIIGQTIKDIYVEKANFDYVDENDIDMVERFANRFQSIRIILENGYSFVVTNDLDYMHIYQEKQE